MPDNTDNTDNTDNPNNSEQVHEEPKSEKIEREELKEIRRETEFSDTLKAEEFKLEEPSVGVMEPVVISDEDIADATARDEALDRVTAALLKVGISEDDLNLAFGVELSSVRKAKLPKRDNTNNDQGQDKSQTKRTVKVDAPK